jgi:SPP1 gp7 family putative phage head morphogenesis protein
MPTRKQSPYLKRAQERQRKRKARENAPKIPAGPEARIRGEVARVLQAFHVRIRDELRTFARAKLQRRALAANDPALDSLLDSLRRLGLSIVAASGIEQAVRRAAEDMSLSAREQVQAALRKTVPASLQGQVQALVNGVLESVNKRVDASLERAQDVFRDWDENEDIEALDTKLDSGLGGILGGALAVTGMIYSAIWADMNADAQESVDVTEYVWVAQRDKVTRPEHAALDNAVANWNEPPLKASQSSSGEDCHAGEDYNCRCVAAPIN